MKSAKKLFFLATFLIISLTTINPLYAQLKVGNGVISGDFALNGMFYQPDSLIGAEKVDSKVRANSWLNLQYTNSGFTVGARYEFYSFPLKSLIGSWLDFLPQERKNTSTMHKIAPIKAPKGIQTPRPEPMVAPKAAPAVTPSIEESASGLLKNP